MKIRILFRKEAGSCTINKAVAVNDYDDLKTKLSDIFKENETKEIVYLWLDNGACIVGLGDEGREKYETDLDKMSEMMIERLKTFGFVEVEGSFGVFEGLAVYDYDSEEYKKLKGVLAR